MSSCRILAQKLNALTTINLTKHDPHGQQDDPPKIIDYHHLDISKDGDIDETGIDWLYGCHHVGFWLKSWTNMGIMLV
jgi:hypothetical protein